MTEIKLHKNEIEYIKIGVESNVWFGNDKKLAERILKKLNQALNIPNVVERSEQLPKEEFESEDEYWEWYRNEQMKAKDV